MSAVHEAWKQHEAVAIPRTEFELLERDAEAYRFLRDPPESKPDAEAAAIWEELLTTGCRGEAWDRTVAELRELYVDRGWK